MLVFLLWYQYAFWCYWNLCRLLVRQGCSLRNWQFVGNNWGEWPSGLRHYTENRKDHGSKPTRPKLKGTWPDFGTQLCHEAPGDLQVESRIKRIYKSWLWGSQVEVKKRQKGKSQIGGNKKIKQAKFSEKQTSYPMIHMCAYQGVKVSIRG